MTIEKLLAENTEALRENTAATLKLIEGREQALEQLANAAKKPAAKKATTTKKPAAKKDEEADKPEEKPAAKKAETKKVAAKKRDVDTSDDALRKLFGDYLKGTDDEDERKTRGEQVKAMLDHFGSPAIAGDKSTLDDDQRYQATFFGERFTNGLPVDFSADYDFDGDPLFDSNEAGDGEGGDELIG